MRRLGHQRRRPGHHGGGRLRQRDQHVGAEGHEHRREALRPARVLRRPEQISDSATGPTARKRRRCAPVTLLARHQPLLTHTAVTGNDPSTRRAARQDHGPAGHQSAHSVLMGGSAISTCRFMRLPAVYIGSVHGLLSAYDEATGTLMWSYQAPGPIYGSPTIANGIAYFGTVNEPQESQAGNYAIALNAQTGDVIWASALPDVPWTTAW